MARSSFIASAALAAIAAMLAVPAAAQDGQNRGRWNRDAGAAATQDAPQQRTWRAEQREAARQERPQRVEVPQSERMQQRAERRAAQAAAAPQATAGWQQRGEGRARYARPQDAAQAAAPTSGDWQQRARNRTDRPDRVADGQRSGRGWSDRSARTPTDTTIERGYRGTVGTSGQWDRNRSYADQSRDRTYGGDRNTRYDRADRRETYRDGYRDGRTADNRYDRRDQASAYRNGYSNGYSTAGRDYRRWDRSDWRRDRRYDWQGYRTRNRHIYHVGRYYSPYRSWSYSRLNIGIFLQPLFYSRNYWIDDPWQYRLPEAYGPYRWVRYYDDALLVDIYSGEVVDVIHDFFW